MYRMATKSEPCRSQVSGSNVRRTFLRKSKRSSGRTHLSRGVIMHRFIMLAVSHSLRLFLWHIPKYQMRSRRLCPLLRRRKRSRARRLSASLSLCRRVGHPQTSGIIYFYCPRRQDRMAVHDAAEDGERGQSGVRRRHAVVERQHYFLPHVRGSHAKSW